MTRAKFFAPLLVLLASLTVGFGEQDLNALRTSIEGEVKSVLDGQLKPGEYYVYAILDARPSNSRRPQGLLPYSGLNVSSGTLEKILDQAYQRQPDIDFTLTLKVGFDAKVPAAKRALLERMLRERFNFDGVKRRLAVESVALVTPEPRSASELLELERARMQAEQERLRAAAELARLEAARRELEAARRMQPPPPPAAPKQELPPPVEPAQTTISLFKDFQLSALALILLLALLVFVIVGGTFFLRGMNPLAAALSNIGAGIESHKPADAVPEAAAQAANPRRLDGASGGVTVAADAAQGAAQAPAPDEAFVKEVQDKLEILVQQGSYNFMRVFADFSANPSTQLAAAAVLTSLSSRSAQKLVEGLALETIQNITSLLATDGGLSRARAMRGVALADFYGRIAVDEYVGSPLIEVRDADWLTRMSTVELARFALDVTAEERPLFLACLSPARLRKIVDVVDARERSKLLKALPLLNSVTRDQVLAFLESIGRRHQGAAKGGEGMPVVDSAAFILAVAEGVSPEEQESLFDSLASHPDLLANVRKRYIPFAAIERLPKAQILELIGDRPDSDVAMILYTANEAVRQLVLEALPNLRRQIVTSELKAMELDPLYDKRNRKASARMQGEIAKALRALHAADLLDLEAPRRVAGQAPGEANPSNPGEDAGGKRDDESAA